MGNSSISPPSEFQAPLRPPVEVEIELSGLHFKFRQLTWREEFSMSTPAEHDKRRVSLSLALMSVSGFQVNHRDAVKIIARLPEPILARVYLLYRSRLPKGLRFSVDSLYCAPAPSVMAFAPKPNDVKPETEEERAQREYQDAVLTRRLAEYDKGI